MVKILPRQTIIKDKGGIGELGNLLQGAAGLYQGVTGMIEQNRLDEAKSKFDTKIDWINPDAPMETIEDTAIEAYQAGVDPEYIQTIANFKAGQVERKEAQDREAANLNLQKAFAKLTDPNQVRDPNFTPDWGKIREVYSVMGGDQHQYYNATRTLREALQERGPTKDSGDAWKALLKGDTETFIEKAAESGMKDSDISTALNNWQKAEERKAALGRDIEKDLDEGTMDRVTGEYLNLIWASDPNELIDMQSMGIDLGVLDQDRQEIVLKTAQERMDSVRQAQGGEILVNRLQVNGYKENLLRGAPEGTTISDASAALGLKELGNIRNAVDRRYGIQRNFTGEIIQEMNPQARLEMNALTKLAVKEIDQRVISGQGRISADEVVSELGSKIDRGEISVDSVLSGLMSSDAEKTTLPEGTDVDAEAVKIAKLVDKETSDYLYGLAISFGTFDPDIDKWTPAQRNMLPFVQTAIKRLEDAGYTQEQLLNLYGNKDFVSTLGTKY